MIPMLALYQADARLESFRFEPSTPARTVHLAGSFNNWNKDATPMKLDADGRTWSVSIRLPYGRSFYKFVVNGEMWLTDPKGTAVDDGNGNQNSLRVVFPADYTSPAKPNDGVVAVSALRHDPEVPALNYDRGKLTLQFRARSGDLAGVTLLAGGKAKAMDVIATDDLYTHYGTSILWDRKTDFTYRFRLLSGGKGMTFADGGLGVARPFRLEAKSFRPFLVPSQISRGPIYQIFPDRFANGSKANDPKNVMPWDGIPTYGNRFGGDAIGVKQNLDYLASLGVQTIYFNPIFASPSNHRYEADSYKLVDPEFGTNADFADMAKAMADRKMGIVMDFAFNHTSPRFFAFKDIMERGEASPYTKWYFIKRYPVVVQDNPPYEAWFGFPSMPKLDVMYKPAQDHLLSVVPFWRSLAPNLVGARLDVANEVDMRFWRAFRKSTKAMDPNFWILGEHWGDGNPWLKGDQWDSVMGYQFREACLQYFAYGNGTADSFAQRLNSIYNSYAPQVSRNLMLLISSHDTARFLTLAKGDQTKQMLAATVQFTWPGVPSVYYGEELGMEGDRDPDNRRGMPWDMATDDNPMLKYYRQLAKVRASSPALQEGELSDVSGNQTTGVVQYRRTLGKNQAWVALNTGKKPQTVTLPAESIIWHDALSDVTVTRDNNTISFLLNPGQSAVLLPTGQKAHHSVRSDPSASAQTLRHSHATF